MHLRITNQGNELLTLSVKAEDIVINVKHDITLALGIPQNDQVLTHRSVFLEDGRSLEEYGITESCSLELHLPLNYKSIVPIRLAISPTEVHCIPIHLNATVGELREKIRHTIRPNFNVAQAFLVYANWVLEDSRQLEDYGMKANACIVVARRLDQAQQSSSEHYDYCDDSPVNSPLSRQRRIKIHVLTATGDPFSLYVDTYRPLKEICGDVESKTGIPAEYQGFILSGRRLDVEKTPDMLMIGGDESFYLQDMRVREIIPSKFQESEINLICEFGRRTVNVTVPANCTVEEAQRIVRNTLAINCRKPDLYFNNDQLQPRKHLKDYGIKDGSAVQVFSSYH